MRWRESIWEIRPKVWIQLFFETWAWKTPSTELLQLNLYGDIEIPYIFGWWNHLVFVRSESFEVYGFDFLIGEDLKPWLLGKLDSTIHGRNITWCVFFCLFIVFFHWWLGRCYEQNGRLDRLVSNYWNPQFSGKKCGEAERCEGPMLRTCFTYTGSDGAFSNHHQLGT